MTRPKSLVLLVKLALSLPCQTIFATLAIESDSQRMTVWSVCFSHNDQFVVTGCDDYICVFNTNTGHEEKRFEGHTDSVWSVACSFDGSMIVSGSEDKSVRLWDVASNKQLQKLDGHTHQVNSVAFSRDGKFIASASWDKTVFGMRHHCSRFIINCNQKNKKKKV